MPSLEQFRSRRLDRKQRRQWRRERRKKHVNVYDAVNKAESSQYARGFFTLK
jgi:hypothetical protein